MAELEPRPLLQLTAQIVSAHVANNSVQTEGLPGLIQQVYGALSSAGADPAPAADRPQPAVPVKRSVQPDHIVCLEDGAKLKMLKRYLYTRFQMTPEQYRERWGLPSDYPMVAPNYAEHRSTLAKSIGLGRKREVEAEVEAEPAPAPAPAPKRGPGRRRKDAAEA